MDRHHSRKMGKTLARGLVGSVVALGVAGSLGAANRIWNGATGTDWMDDGVWRDDSGNAYTWTSADQAYIPAGSSIAVSSSVEIGGDVNFQGGEITITGNGSIALQSNNLHIENSTVTSAVPWDFRNGNSLQVYGPGSFHAPSATFATGWLDIRDGGGFILDSDCGSVPTPVFYGTNPATLADLGGSTSAGFPVFYGPGTLRNVKCNTAGDQSLNNCGTCVYDTGVDLTNRHRLQLNGGDFTIRNGAKLTLGEPSGTAYGVFVGLDVDSSTTTLTVEGGELMVNADLMGTQAGGLGIACMGGTQHNTTGTVTLNGGTTKVATVMMTSNWVPGNQAQGWHSGGRGKFVHTGGEFETWKIFAGNTTGEGSNNTQEWRFNNGATGTIGSIRQGKWTKVDFLMDGYTVKAYEDTAAWFVSDGTPVETQSYTIGANGLTFDTNGKNVALDLSTWTRQGPLTKTGLGRLQLMCDWSNQALTVNAGTLAYKVASANTALTVAAGATLEAVATADGVPVITADTTTIADGATIKVTGFPPCSGTYPLVDSANLSADLANVAFDATGLETGSAQLVATADGLALQINSYTPAELTYRGTVATALWNLVDANWINDQSESVVWTPNSIAKFDGAAAAGITVAEKMVVGGMNFTGTADFSLLGSGTLEGTGALVKSGTGTLVLDGPALTQQPIEVREGTLKLGENASAAALGPENADGSAGAVTVFDGATFNANYNHLAAGTDSARSYITHRKTFKIAGEGVNGKGALVNESDTIPEADRQNFWNAMLRRIELTDDATIGGNARMDVRLHSNAGTTSEAGVFGSNYCLTVKNTGVFAPVQLPLDVNSVRVTEGGIFRPEAIPVDQWKVPGGITLDNGTLHGYSQTIPATTAIDVTENGGAIQAENNSTFLGPVKVAANARVRLTGGGDDYFKGGVANNGEVEVVSGWQHISKGTLSGEGSWTVTSGNLIWQTALDLGKPRTVNLVDGWFYYGKETDTTSGKLNQKLTINATEGKGSFMFNTCSPTTYTAADIAFNNAPRVLVFGTNPNDTGIRSRFESVELSSTTYMCWGKDGTPSNVDFGPGVVLNARGEAYFGDSSGDKISVVRFEPGSSLTTGGLLWTGTHGSKHPECRVEVNGGNIKVGSEIVLGSDGQYAYMDLNSGVVDTQGILSRWGETFVVTNDEQFTMNGGTLRLGASGLHAWTHFNPAVQLNAGTLECTADWVVERMRAFAFGDQAGGNVTFDLKDKSIQWRTGLAGLANVTLTGTGNFTSGTTIEDAGQYMQGVLSGKWKVENTGTSDLSGAAAFGGGLELAENVNASIDIGGEQLVQSVFMKIGGDAMNTLRNCYNTYPFACNNLTFMHSTGGEAYYAYGGLMWQGQFYVDTEGTWTFAAGYDDATCIDIDGENVMSCTTWSDVGRGTKQLTVGWHDFRIVQSQNAGGYGSVPGGWANVMNVGFAKHEVGDNNASSYQRFDGEHLQLRGVPAFSVGGSMNWHGISGTENWTTRTDWTWHDTFKELSKNHIYNVALKHSMSVAAQLFDGWVFVKATQAGDWQVTLDYDDGCRLAIDGVDSGADGNGTRNGSIAGVTPGWHRFDLRIMDGGGAWGPWGGTSGCFAKVVVNGKEFKFDEQNFCFSPVKPVEYAGLYGITELKAGSRLTNKATASCPIWGTIAGSGTFAGAYAFAGEAGCLKVTGEGNVPTVMVPKFEDGDANAYAKLAKVAVEFERRGSVVVYDLGPAYGANPAQIELSVKYGEGVDDTEKFALVVANERLKLRNRRMNGTTLFVR